jgi:hypothetical protein
MIRVYAWRQPRAPHVSHAETEGWRVMTNRKIRRAIICRSGNSKRR